MAVFVDRNTDDDVLVGVVLVVIVVVVDGITYLEAEGLL